MSKTMKKNATSRQRGEKPATVRISPRFPPATAALLEKASAMRGLTVTGFVIEASRSEAERVIAEEARWKLDEAETRAMIALLANPPKPNAAARKAASLAADVTVRRRSAA